MKLIIAGSRRMEIKTEHMVGIVNFFKLKPTEIVSGCAEGVDKCGESYAIFCGNIPIKRFKPDWKMHGKAAGPIRNREMAKYADILLVIWDGESTGSLNMRGQMENFGKSICEVVLR